ncbi:MAG: dCTP deaminase [Microthrixaceae bacterium]
MILSDRTIRAEIEAGRIGVEPYDPSMVQPSSIDVRLDHRFLVFRSHTRPVIDVKEDLSDLTELVTASEEQPFILHPGEFVLGATLEVIRIPVDLVARVEGKSSLGRLGLLIHTTAGFVDAGFQGQLTLEFSNVATLPITLYPGMKIGQLSFLRMDGPAEHPYGSGALGSKYSGQLGPTPSQYWKNFRS